MKSRTLRIVASATCFATAGVLTLATPAYADRPMQESAGAQESAGQMADDTTITGKVKSAIAQDERVDASSIQVSTDNGIVQLSGFASSPQEADHAAALARAVPGVKDVKNGIELKPQSQQPQSQPQQQ